MRPGQRPARLGGRGSAAGSGRGGRRRGAAAALRPLPPAAARGGRSRPDRGHRPRAGRAQRAAPVRLRRRRPGPAPGNRAPGNRAPGNRAPGNRAPGNPGDTVTDAVSLITAKRDGHRLAGADIRWLFGAYADGQVADEQMSALLMAIYFNGLDDAELRTWTAAMIDSGDRLDLSAIARPTVDKHSTGGVGDKVSLILAPLVASCGAAVPQLSGRGLGHTGGTLDKLESIPGFRTSLTPEETIRVLHQAGCVICAAGSGLAPADRR